MWQADQNIQNLVKKALEEIGMVEASKIRVLAAGQEVLCLPFYIAEGVVDTVSNIFQHTGELISGCGKDGNLIKHGWEYIKHLCWDLLGLVTGPINSIRIGYRKSLLKGIINNHPAVVCTFTESILALAIADRQRYEDVFQAYAGDETLAKVFERAKRIYKGEEKVKTPAIIAPNAPEIPGVAVSLDKQTENLIDQTKLRVDQIAAEYNKAKAALELKMVHDQEVMQAERQIMQKLLKELPAELQEKLSIRAAEEFSKMSPTILASLASQVPGMGSVEVEELLKEVATKKEANELKVEASKSKSLLPKVGGNPDKDAAAIARAERLAAEEKKKAEVHLVPAGAGEASSEDLEHPGEAVG